MDILICQYTNKENFTNVGEIIEFTFILKNIGSATMKNVQFKNSLQFLTTCFGLSPETFLPNERRTCSIPYVITQDDMNRKYISNKITISRSKSIPSNLSLALSPNSEKNNDTNDDEIKIIKDIASGSNPILHIKHSNFVDTNDNDDNDDFIMLQPFAFNANIESKINTYKKKRNILLFASIFKLSYLKI